MPPFGTCRTDDARNVGAAFAALAKWIRSRDGPIERGGMPKLDPAAIQTHAMGTCGLRLRHFCVAETASNAVEKAGSLVPACVNGQTVSPYSTLKNEAKSGP